MTSHTPGRAWLLGELRRVEWRRLLLAIALLSAWGRALVPQPAAAAAEAAALVLCSVAGEARGSGDAAPEAAHETRACPFCRLTDPPAGLPPCPPAIAWIALGAAGDLPPAGGKLTLRQTTPHPPARGPPATATTI